MLKQYLTKVIAVAACALFIAGCAEEAPADPADKDKEAKPAGEADNPDK